MLARRSLAKFVQQAIAAGEVDGIQKVEWGPHLDAICSQVQAQMEGWLVSYGLGSPAMVERQREAWERTGAAWEDGLPEPWLRYPLVQNAIDNIPPGTLKPCDVNGLVLEKTRGSIRLGDVNEGDCVLTHMGRFRRVVAVADQGVIPTLVLITRRGRRVRLAGDHPVMTSHGWTRADQVKIGDALAEVLPSEEAGQRTISLPEARLIGYLIGDGTVQESVGFTNQNEETLDDFKFCVESLGFTHAVASRKPSKTGPDTYCLRIKTKRQAMCECGEPRHGAHARCRACQKQAEKEARKAPRVEGSRRMDPEIKRQRRDTVSSGAVRRWLVSRGLSGKCSYTKRVPAEIMAGDTDVIAEYLAAYWACDGGIYQRSDLKVAKTGKRAIRVDATTVSEGLAHDHQVLLSRMGLPFTLYRQDLKIVSKRQGARYIAYKLVAHDQDTVAKFMQVIGSRIRHEKRTRVPGVVRTGFDRVLVPDEVVRVESAEPTACRCLQVEEDSSFAYQGVAVHNSTIVMNCANAWIWLWAPTFSFGALSGIDANVGRDSRACRDLVRSNWYRETFGISWRDIDTDNGIPDFDVKSDTDAIEAWATTAGGKRLSRTILRGLTGVHVDGIFCDDPDDADKVFNEAERLRPQNRWSRSTETRVNDEQRSIRRVLQQVVHPEGMSAYLLSLKRWSPQNPKGWSRLCIPAEFGFGPEDAPVETPYGWRDWRTTKGEVMHARLSPGILADKRMSTPSYEGQFNQNPRRTGGGMFALRHARFFELEDAPLPLRRRPEGCLQHAELPAVRIKMADLHGITLSVDAANSLDPKPGAKVSAVGLLVAGCRGEDRFALDDRTRVLGVSGTYRAIYDILAAWPIELVLVELKALGAGVIREVEMAIRRGWFMDADSDERVELLGPDGKRVRCKVEAALPGKEDKVQRAHGMLPMWEAGQMYVRDGADWLYPQVDESRRTLDEGHIGEVCSFPASRRSDRVDTWSQFVTRWRGASDTRSSWQAMRRIAMVGVRGRGA